jgi:two-component system NtrC family sensor kinase
LPDRDPYKTAYERERFARKHAESLLDEKSRNLTNSVVDLQATVEALEETQEQLIQSEKNGHYRSTCCGHCSRN